MLAIDLGLFLLGCIALVFAGSNMVRSIIKIARFLRIGEFIAGFIIVGLATSLPELLVGITSALKGIPSLALGTIIGSNILDLTLVLGIVILVARGISVKTKKIQKNALFMFALLLIPLILMLIGNTLSRLDGIILVIIFFSYILVILRQHKEFTKKMINHVPRGEVIANSFLFIASLFLLYISAQWIVNLATSISIDLNLPYIVIGLFLVSIGTSLPELVVEVEAVLKGYNPVAVGDVIGSVVANSTLILGVTALIHPITTNMLFFFTSTAFMVLVAFLFITFISTKKLNIRVGISLLLLYIFFVMLEFYLKTI